MHFEDAPIYDGIVIGGGVSGTYAAWRLMSSKMFRSSMTHDPPQVALFEASERIGGRLYSVSIPECPELYAELGGMRFMKDQESVYHLAEHLQLPVENFGSTAPNNPLYLRGHHLCAQDFVAHPEYVPYHLLEHEIGKDPWQLLHETIERSFPQIRGMRRSEMREYLKGALYRGQPLWKVGFLDFLLHELSTEGYQFIHDTISYDSWFTNRNAYDAFLVVALDIESSKVFKLKNGFDTLPKTMAKEFIGCGGEIYLETTVRSIKKNSASPEPLIEVEVMHQSVQKKYTAKNVIVALPRRAIELLDRTSCFFECAQFQEDIQHVMPYSASKFFVWYPHAWWTDLGVHSGSAETDLPLRKCYYFGEAPVETSNFNRVGLLLASYRDHHSVHFWSDYLSNQMHTHSKQPPVIPAEMIEELHRELSELHGITIPPPIKVMFQDWSRDPYGGGWHFWQRGCQSWIVIPRLRRPMSDTSLYFCGEAISSCAGFVEGAINSAEKVLQDYFGLERPSWVSASYDFGP